MVSRDASKTASIFQCFPIKEQCDKCHDLVQGRVVERTVKYQGTPNQFWQNLAFD